MLLITKQNQYQVHSSEVRNGKWVVTEEGVEHSSEQSPSRREWLVKKLHESQGTRLCTDLFEWGGQV